MSPQHERRAAAARLRNLRDMLGLTQREMAAEFKVTHGAIAGWESGARPLPGPVLKLIELYEDELQIEGNRDGFTRLKASMASRSLALSHATALAVARGAAAVLDGLLVDDARGSAITTRAHRAMARQVVRTLGNLKALAMKMGQTLAYLDFAVPEAVRRELEVLLTSSRPMATSVVTRIFLEEFGRTPRQIFAEWSAEPFAAASIGQVHRARLRTGEAVAVKVQYPAIKDALEADLRNARLIERVTAQIFRGHERGALLAEMRERFLEECDYRIEAENQEEFRRLWRERPGVRIPRVHRELTSRRVLVTEFIEGASFESFVARASPEERDRAGETLLRFAYESYFRHELFHADPHPGNYLFADGDVVFLDFGCVKRTPAKLVANWRALICAALERDFDRVHQRWIDMGAAPERARYDFTYDRRVVQTLYEPWLTDERFEFSPEKVARLWRILVVENPNKFRMSLPKDWVFAERMQWGLFSVLARLGARVSFRGHMLDLLYEPGASRPPPYTRREIAALYSSEPREQRAENNVIV